MKNIYNPQAEQAVLGSILSNPKLFDQLPDDLCGSDFSPVNRRIFEAFTGVVESGGDVDVILVAEALSKSGSDELAYLTELVTTSNGSNVKAYAEVIIKFSVNRSIAALCPQIHSIAEDTAEPDAKISEISALVSGLERNRKLEVVDFNGLLRQELIDLDRKSNLDGEPSGLMTGFEQIDSMHSGWEAGDLIVMAGRPSMGKTTLAMNIAENVADEGKNILVFSLEMTAQMLTRRLISSKSKIPMGALKTGNLSEDDWPRLELGTRKLKDTPIKIYDLPGMHIRVMQSIARRENRKQKLDLIVVDYLQLISGTTGSNFDGRTNEISHISRMLKVIAKETSTPVIAISQLSRKCEERADKRPMSSDLRESGQIEQDADFICFVYRDEQYNADSPAKGIAEVITTKNRNGETGTAYLASQLQFNRFNNLTHDYVPSAPESPSGYRY